MATKPTVTTNRPGKPAGYSSTLHRALLSAESSREALEGTLLEQAKARSSILARSLGHRDRTETVRLVSEFLAGFPSIYATGKEQMRIMVIAYVKVFEDLPPWAVEEVIGRWRRSDANKAFAPTAEELRGFAQEIVWQLEAERVRFDKVLALPPRVPSPDGRTMSPGLQKELDELRVSLSENAKEAAPWSRPPRVVDKQPSAEVVAANLDALRARLIEMGKDPGELDQVPSAADDLAKWGQLSAARDVAAAQVERDASEALSHD